MYDKSKIYKFHVITSDDYRKIYTGKVTQEDNFSIKIETIMNEIKIFRKDKVVEANEENGDQKHL